ncbi:MAG: hypothetical protein RLZZ152_1392, partial [Pseudomonadota bacterium]
MEQWRDGRNVFALLEQNAHSVLHHFGVKGERVQGNQGFGPFHAFGNAGC